jgi:hypothetical protein
MTARYFVVAGRSGAITHKPAEATIAANLDAYFELDTPLYEVVLAQADSEEQAQRFVELLVQRRMQGH